MVRAPPRPMPYMGHNVAYPHGGGGGAANYNNPSYSLKGFGGYGGSGIVIVANSACVM